MKHSRVVLLTEGEEVSKCWSVIISTEDVIMVLPSFHDIFAAVS